MLTLDAFSSKLFEGHRSWYIFYNSLYGSRLLNVHYICLQSCYPVDMSVGMLLTNRKHISQFSSVNYNSIFTCFIITYMYYNSCSVPRVHPLHHGHTLPRHLSTVLHHQELQLAWPLQQWLCQRMLLQQLINPLLSLHKIKIVDSVKVRYSCNEPLYNEIHGFKKTWMGIVAEI